MFGETVPSKSVPGERVPSSAVSSAVDGSLAPGDDAFLVALASVDLGPGKLNRLVRQHGAWRAWRLVVDGTEPTSPEAHKAATRLDVAAVWQAHQDAGVGVCSQGSAAYPGAFADDPDAPAVLFHRGDIDVLSGPRVAIVGTRRCTRYGLDVACELGEGLAAAGVSVVSGLALGIDAAAHRGALVGGAPPIGVVGSGLDVVYPRRNRQLWDDVAAAGVVLSETALGGKPIAWRFPARNRLIAALADVVVVVESHDRGGSLSTVAEAIKRDRTVMAVPGPIRSPASAGTNRLLADGCAPVCEIDDVLVALGLSPGRRRPATERRPRPDPTGAQVLDALGWQPGNVEQLALRTGLGVVDLLLCLDQLQTDGWVAGRGGWYERVGRDRATG